MGDYGRDLSFGTFLTPDARAPQRPVALAQLSEQSGLDLVTFQDHPYQPAFLDTWTLLSYAAARTDRVSLSANVLNLPLRGAGIIARSAASLDLLSEGRFELGLGAGAFWDAIEAMGADRLTPGESVDALEEALAVIRGIWDVDDRTVLRVDGRHHHVDGTKRGPAPAHDIGIWLGALRPRMLRLIGRTADGWLPSLAYLQPGQLAEGQRIIDDAALEAGRDPRAIRRLLNILDADQPERLAELAIEDGVDTFILATDDPATVQRFGEEIAPAVRELVAATRVAPPAERGRDEAVVSQPVEAARAEAGEYERLGVTPTADDGTRLAQPLWDEATRPHRAESGADVRYTDRQRQRGQHLVDVHDYLRGELEQLRDVVAKVRAGTLEIGAARSVVNEMTMRQNDWTMGAYCARYCAQVTTHHTLEDESIFPHLRRREPALAPVIDRLEAEHHVIHDVLEALDRALVGLVTTPGDFTALQTAVDQLTDTMNSHLAYEERELVEPLARLGFYDSQL